MSSPSGALKIGDQVGQRLTHPGPESSQLCREPGEPPVTFRRIPLRRARIGDRIDQAPGIDVLAGQRLGDRCPDAVPAGATGSGGGDGPAGPALGLAASRASRSAIPSRQRAPVSSLIAAAPAVGSTSTRRVATRSAISGSSSNPPRPTTSTGNPAARNASAVAGHVAPAAQQYRGGRRRRGRVQSIAARHRSAIDLASQASSSATVANSPYRTSPGRAHWAAVRNSPTGTGAAGPVRIEAESSLANASTDCRVPEAGQQRLSRSPARRCRVGSR